MPSNLIACRLATYGQYQERAWTHLPSIGIKHIEMPVPDLGEIAAIQDRLAKHGLTVISLQGKCQITQPDAVEAMRTQMYACSELRVKYLFLSVKAGDMPRHNVWSTLRAIGDLAATERVTVVLETHPDLITNGDVGRETMEAVRHPNIRINFDTGNVYYYNHNTTASGELAKCIDYVRTVHLKETNGQFECWHFPALGQGVVDFPEVFRMLNARGFTGPFTMELEGIKGQELDETGQLKMVEDSVAYLRQIGAMS